MPAVAWIRTLGRRVRLSLRKRERQADGRLDSKVRKVPSVPALTFSPPRSLQSHTSASRALSPPPRTRGWREDRAVGTSRNTLHCTLPAPHNISIDAGWCIDAQSTTLAAPWFRRHGGRTMDGSPHTLCIPLHLVNAVRACRSCAGWRTHRSCGLQPERPHLRLSILDLLAVATQRGKAVLARPAPVVVKVRGGVIASSAAPEPLQPWRTRWTPGSTTSP